MDGIEAKQSGMQIEMRMEGGGQKKKRKKVRK